MLLATTDLSEAARKDLEIFRDVTNTQEACADAHARLEEDKDLTTLNAQMFSDVEGTSMAEFGHLFWI